MRDRIVRVATPAASPPVSVADMKAHLRVTHNAEDDVIEDCINDAVASIGIDGELGIALGSQTINESLQYPGRDTYLSVAPATALVSVKYYDTDNIEQTANPADFEFYASDEWAFVRSSNWPATYDRPDAVTIQYTAGGEVSPDICRAIKLIAAHWYENRDDTSEVALKEIPRAASHLLGLHRLGWYG